MTAQSQPPRKRNAHPWAPGTLNEILPEGDFVPLVAAASEGLLGFHGLLARTPRAEWAKRHYNRLYQEADDLETFLDNHGARDNRTFYLFRELVAGVRGFAAACHVAKHVEMRMGHYHLEAAHPDLELFHRDLQETLGFTQDSLLKLLDAVSLEARRVGCAPPQGLLADGQVLDEMVRRRLPHNVEDLDPGVDEARVVGDLAILYLETTRRFERLPSGPVAQGAAMHRFLESHFGEEAARTLQAMVHNLQSRYDTCCRDTLFERRHPRLPSLRGHASVALHLMELATLLVHFYQRHETELRAVGVGAEGLRRIVDGAAVLDRSVNFALVWARFFLLAGQEAAQELAARFGEESRVELELPRGMVLHARPASLIVAVVNHHGKPVEMEIDGETANAGSIMQMMILAGMRPSATRAAFRGHMRTLEDLRLLFAAGLGEDGLSSLPPELSYLLE